MYASVHAFLHEIIDYAGLFPPAKQALDVALAEYLHTKATSPYRWMLASFVCPAVRLTELLPLAQAHEHRSLLSITVLGQQAADHDAVHAKLQTDIAAIQAFRRAWGDAAVIDAIEIPLPEGELPRFYPCPSEAIHQFLLDIVEALTNADLSGFVELPRRPPSAATGDRDTDHWLRWWDKSYWQSELGDVARGLSSVHGHGERPPRLGLKLRCGGVAADAFPSDDHVACFIDHCWTAPLIWKATAGLHHPYRHWDAGLNLWRHGFLNVFGAGLLAMAHPLTPADLVAILSDREGKHFHFEEERFAWKDWSCTAAQIAEFRARGPTSFGSCSFAEPCADLTALGLLDC